MLRVMVIYDIRETRIRNRICDICLDYGLDREQYSVFNGLLRPSQMRALAKELANTVDDESHILLIPVAADDWQRRVEIGRPLHVER